MNSQSCKFKPDTIVIHLSNNSNCMVMFYTLFYISSQFTVVFAFLVATFTKLHEEMC